MFFDHHWNEPISFFMFQIIHVFIWLRFFCPHFLRCLLELWHHWVKKKMLKTWLTMLVLERKVDMEKELLSISFAVSSYTLIPLIFDFFSNSVEIAKCNLAEHLLLCLVLCLIIPDIITGEQGVLLKCFPQDLQTEV